MPYPAYTSGLRLGAAIALGSVLLVGGCSIAIPIPSLLSDPDQAATAVAWPKGLNEEDQRRAAAALAAALGSNADGTAVPWENPESGAKGSFSPAGAATTGAHGTCRGFLAELATTAGAQALQGSACREASGGWILRELTPREGS